MSEFIDCGSDIMIPGIFDTHNHACFGYSPDGKTAEEIRIRTKKYLKGLAAFGVTSVFPTLFATKPDQESLDSIAVLAEFVGKGQDGASPLGIHFEGPFLNRTGEHSARYQPDAIDMSYVQKCMEAARGTLRLMGHAVELENSRELTDYLIKNHCVAAMAHTDADAETAFKAFEYGISVATHTCNVMTGIHHRDVGALGAALLDDRVHCELICDGLHVCNDMLKLILRAKSHDRIMLISDSSRFVGMPNGVYHVHDEGKVTVDRDGRVLTEDGALNGSSKGVIFGIRNLVKNVGIALEDASMMASKIPCDFYGCGNCKGTLEQGKDADFVLVNDNFDVHETYCMGRRVYSSETDTDLANPDLRRES